MQSSTKIWVALIAVAIIALGGYAYPQVQARLGGVTNYDEVDATAIKIGGTNGSRIGPVISGTCNLLGMDASATATTSSPYDCAVTGVVSGDTVIATLGTTSLTANLVKNGWFIVGAKASSTSGFITIQIANYTGGAATPSTQQVGSSTNYLVAHPVTSVPGL